MSETAAAAATEKVVEQVNWELLFQPSEWHIRPDVVMENYQTLLISFGLVLVTFLLFLFARSRGVNDDWWRKLKRSKYSISQTKFLLFWGLFYIPLALSSWLVWINSGN